MTTPTRTERTLPTILDDLAAGPSPEYLDDVFARTGRMRQRPGWTFPERWLPMADITRSRAFAPAPPWRTLAVALVVLVLIAAAAVAFVGSRQQRVPPPFGPAANGLITYDSGGDIYVGDPVTGQTRLVVGGTDSDSAPGFSPDGTRIAFFRSASPSELDLFTVRPDGTDLRRATTTSLPSEPWVQWAPDSRHLAAIHTVDGHDRLDLFGVDGQAQRLAGAVDLDQFSYRPPLAKEIVFRALVDGHYSLQVMNADGTNVRTLARSTLDPSIDLDLNGATYSADGSRIFYQHWTPDAIQLWVMDADGSNQHQFVSDLANGWEGLVAPSPDGQWIAFWRVFPDQSTQRVSVVRADGTGPVIQIGPDLIGDANWAWAPDSSKILMTATDPGDAAGPYLLDPTGGAWTIASWAGPGGGDWQRLALTP